MGLVKLLWNFMVVYSQSRLQGIPQSFNGNPKNYLSWELYLYRIWPVMTYFGLSYKLKPRPEEQTPCHFSFSGRIICGLAFLAGGSGYPSELRSRKRVQKATQVARRMGRSLFYSRLRRSRKFPRGLHRKKFRARTHSASYAGYLRST